MKYSKTKKIIRIILPVLMLVTMLFVFHHAGTYLVHRDPVTKGDAILILMGSIADRVLEASDLYQQDLADQILIVEENMGSVNLLKSRGANLISNTEQCRNVAIDLGVAVSDITIIPGEANSTIKEARLVCEYLLNHVDVDTLLIVTSPAHTRRAGMIFNNAFKNHGLKVTVITCPSRYGSYSGKTWYLNREEIQEAVYEYIKLFAFLSIEQFKKP